MKLTPEQQAMLSGEKGETMAKVVKTLVMYGDTFGAERMVPITSKYGHTVISFGLKVMKPVYDLYQEIIDAGLTSDQKFTADPKPLDKHVPSSLIEDLVFKKFMYTYQDSYEQQLRELGITSDDDYTCTCYLDQVGNKPNKGEVLSWAESSAVVYANSVLGARCNRNSGMIDLFQSILGRALNYGFTTDEGRRATWRVEVKTTKKPEAQILGSAIGMKVMEDVPYIVGLDKFIGTELNDDAKAYLKDMGAATASNGAVGLYHVDNLTPEAKEQGESLIVENAKTYVIDDAELERVYKGYPVMWKNKDAKAKVAFIGCPHLTYSQLVNWTNNIVEGLKKSGKTKVTTQVILTAAPQVAEKFRKTDDYKKLVATGARLSSICPLMYTNNPICGGKPIVTSSNKLRTYSKAKYMKDEDILKLITGQEA